MRCAGISPHSALSRRRVSGVLASSLRCSSTRPQNLPPLAREARCALLGQLQMLDERIRKLEAVIVAVHRNNEVIRRLASVPGVGPVTASAMVASVADARQFKSQRYFAAW